MVEIYNKTSKCLEPWFDPVCDVLELSYEFYILGYGMITKHFLDNFWSNNIPSCKMSIFSNYLGLHCISGKNHKGIFSGKIKLWKHMVDIEIFLLLYCIPWFFFSMYKWAVEKISVQIYKILLVILQQTQCRQKFSVQTDQEFNKN